MLSRLFASKNRCWSCSDYNTQDAKGVLEEQLKKGELRKKCVFVTADTDIKLFYQYFCHYMILPTSCGSVNTISRSGFVFRQILRVLSQFIADHQVTIVGLRALALLLTSGTLCLCVGPKIQYSICFESAITPFMFI